MCGCTSYRFYSTQEKLTEEVENDETEDNSSSNYSGNMKIKPVSLPENIENNIKLLLENYPLPQLKQDSEYLRRYVSCRKPPAQKSAVENLRNRALEKFEQKYPADPSLMSEDVLNFYEENKRSFVNKFVSQNLYNWKPITYNEYHSLLHLYAHSVPQYAVIFKILYEITKRDEQFSPISMFDFGSGVGINTWAAYKYWSKSIIEYYCVDNSSIIQNVAHSILTSNNENKKPFINNVYFRQFLPETSRPYDIVFCTYSLMELPAQSSRLKVLTNLWNKTKKYLVLVEVGTLAGFNLITEARDYILQSDNDCHVFGPCTHDVTCPRTFDTTPCNFFVKYQPLKLTEINQVKVELYSYVVLKKGPRSQDNDESYSRIVRAVLPRHKHVVCKLCTCEGKLNDTYFTKRKNGKEIYKIVRKSNWGDIIPTKFNKDVAVNGSLSSGDADIDDTGQRENYTKYYLPWAIRTGNTSGFLMGVYFEKRWEQKIEDFYNEFNITPLKIKRKNKCVQN